jgi:hypothetical protein
MSEEIIENLDTVVPEEVKTPEVKEEGKPEADVKTVLAQKEHFRTKAERLEKELSEAKGKPAEATITLEAIKIGKKLEKYSDEVIDDVAKVIKSTNPNDILAALENPYIKRGIEAKQQEEINKSKVPGSSGSIGYGNQKSPDEIRKLTPEEHMKLDQESLRPSTGI